MGERDETEQANLEIEKLKGKSQRGLMRKRRKVKARMKRKTTIEVISGVREDVTTSLG